MKSSVYLLISSMVFLSVVACSDKPARPSSVLSQSQIDAANARAAVDANSTAITPPSAQTPEPPQNAAGVWHYTCSNGCAGGAGSATACATCGTTLVHNQGYHAASGTPIPQTNIGTPAAGAAATGLPTTITPPVQTAAEPPQNAAGVWHYTCANGCAGGAGSAVACASCGSTLVHNQGYH